MLFVPQQPAHCEPPHEHDPFEHRSPVLHMPQAAPAFPHWVSDWEANGTHMLPLQQPIGQDVASQTHCPLVLHASPATHTWQAAPPAPQTSELSAESDTHVVPLQQPLQLLLLQDEASAGPSCAVASKSPGQDPASHVE